MGADILTLTLTVQGHPLKWFQITVQIQGLQRKQHWRGDSRIKKVFPIKAKLTLINIVGASA